MAKTPRELEVQKVEVSQNSTQTRDIPKTILRALQCRLNIRHDNAGSVANWNIDAVLNLLGDMEFILNGQDVVHKVPLAFYYYQNFYDNAGVVSQSILATTSTSSLCSYVDFNINFTNPRSIAPDDTVLDLRNGISTAVLKSSFGAVTATGVTLRSGESDIEICTDEYLYDSVEDADTTKVRGRYETIYTQKDLTSTGQSDIEIPVGLYNEYKRFFLETKTAAGVRSDSIIDKIELYSGALTFIKKNADLVKAQNAVDYGIATGSLLTGLYVIDLTRLGKMSQRLVTTKLPELKFRVNVVTAGKIRIFAEKTIFSAG